MRRILKNTIMIFLIVVLFVVNYLVMGRIKDEYYNKVRTSAFEVENNKSEEKPVVNLDKKVDGVYYLVFVSLDGSISILACFLVMSKFNSKTLARFVAKPKRVVVYLLVTTGLTLILVVSNVVMTKNLFMTADLSSVKVNKKKTVKFELDMQNVVEKKQIDLSSIDENVVFEKEGEYEFTGNFKNSLIINSEGDVSLKLKDVVIASNETAAIIVLKAKSVKIITEKDTISSLSDFGETEYNAAIYSNSEVIFEGDGVLKVNGRNLKGSALFAKDVKFDGGNVVIDSQNKGIVAEDVHINDGAVYVKSNNDGIIANNLVVDGGNSYIMAKKNHSAISTKDEFVINSGTFIATGYSTSSLPSEEGKQKSICISLDDEILWGTPVALKSVKDELALSFKAESDFKNVILSSSKITNDKYNLYVDGDATGVLDRGIYSDGKYTKGKKVVVNDEDVFEVKDSVTVITSKSDKEKETSQVRKIEG